MTQEDEHRRAWFRREILPLEPDLLAYARQFCRDGQTDPEDLVHETFARTIACKTWREIGNPGAFATRTLRNCALDALRRRKVLTITAVADFERIEPIDETPGAHMMLESREELRALADAIAELPAQCRRVFTLRKVYSLSPDEIAVRLGLSVSTVEKHLVKGLRYCSDKLGRRIGRKRKVDEGRSWSGRRDHDAKR
jgi:RNA polymerase sigma factor (sigma-70 family)